MERPISRPFRHLALVAVLAASAGACETTHLFSGDPEMQIPKAAEWLRGEPFTAPSFDSIWERATDVLMGEGYRIDESGTSASRGEIRTGWVTHLAPTRYQGKRRRVWVRIEPVQSSGGGTAADAKQWRIAVVALRQRNADIDDPSNPVSAQWEADGVDETRTALLQWKMEQPFRPE